MILEIPVFGLGALGCASITHSQLCSQWLLYGVGGGQPSVHFSPVKSLILPLFSCALKRLRMMIKPVVLVKSQENGPDQQTENQTQNPANEEAYI